MSETTSLFEAALARLRENRVVRATALGGSVMLTLPAGACVDAVEHGELEAADWAQYEGKRDASMISYTGAWSSECTGGNTRFGCGGYAIHLNVRVKPVVGADLNWKRVGVVYRSHNDLTDRTAVGSYQYTHGDGTEEWKVTVNVPQWQRTIVFDAWYQDGKGQTWIDDNQGEFHVVNAGPVYNVIRVEPWLQTVTVGDAGVQGRVSIQIADLDFDKQLELVATTDGWQTVHRFGIGDGKNAWHWTEDFQYAGSERWQIDVDVPGAADRFEYAVVYRHGVVNGAKSYEFWENNGGGNFVVERSQPAPQ